MPLDELDASDVVRLRAVQGWLELGMASDAAIELAALPDGCRDHPVVLDTAWAVAAAQDRWDDAYGVGRRLVELHPRLESGWIHRSFAARRMSGGSVEQALAQLLPAATRFPDLSLIPYNLACYLATLGRVDEAWRWYTEAERRESRREGKPHLLRRQALQDPDLAALRARIESL
jgi:tetratricopeptide (TPR) repeat protein